MKYKINVATLTKLKTVIDRVISETIHGNIIDDSLKDYTFLILINNEKNGYSESIKIMSSIIQVVYKCKNS